MRFLALVASTAIALTAIPAAANAAPDVPSTIVQTNDLDLADSADQDRLQQRIEGKVRTMCRSRAGGLIGHKLDKQCRATALADASGKAEIAIAMAERSEVRIAATPSDKPEA